MNRVQFEEAITKCEKTIKKNFAKRELNDLWLFIGRERQLHNDDNADELATKIYKYLKNSQKGLKSNNVEETQWWIGDLFILLCENKEFVDPAIYQELVFLKNLILDSVATILFIHTRFKDKQRLEEEYNKLLKIISLKISEIQYFLQKENVQL